MNQSIQSIANDVGLVPTARSRAPEPWPRSAGHGRAATPGLSHALTNPTTRRGGTPGATRWVWAVLLALGLGLGSRARGASDGPTEWRFEQPLQVPQAGLQKVGLSAESLGTGRAELEDLRVLDPAGREVPYVIERSHAAAAHEQRPKSFAATLNPDATVLLLETGLTMPIDSVELVTPASDLIKAVRVEGAPDREAWQVVVQEAPIFRQASGLEQLRVALPKVTFRWLRLTIDDRRTAPVPFTGASLSATSEEVRPETVLATVTERTENRGESRLRLTLPAPHLLLAGVDLEISDPVFSREVTLSTRGVVDGTVREAVVARGTVYRLAFDAMGAVSNHTVVIERQIPTRELMLAIDNQDSPPLGLSGVRVHWRPVYLVFRAADAGTYRILLGNNLCPAPRYDLAALSANLRALPVSPLEAGTIRANAAYRPPPALPTVRDTAAPLDTAAWKYRSEARLNGIGAQELELPLPVLARAQAGLADLRLLRETNQIPYVLDAGFTHRVFTPEVRVAPDPKRPRVSRWEVKLPQTRLPVGRLTCTSATPLFHRSIVAYEERPDDRGDRRSVLLGTGTWQRTPDQAARRLGLEFSMAPETDTLWVETDNGENPPLDLGQFEVHYPASRILFKSEQAGNLWLYYGNPAATAPRYDLSLVADQLLAADRSLATLGPEQRLHGMTWQEQFGRGGRGGPLIWGVLIGVVIALLLVVKQLVPRGD